MHGTPPSRQLLVTRKIYFQNPPFSKRWHAHSSWDGKAAPKQIWATKQAVQLQVSPSWPPAGRQAQSHPTEHMSSHGMTMRSTTPTVWVPYPTLLLLQCPRNKNKHKGQLRVGREGMQLQLPFYLKLASAVFCAFIQSPELNARVSAGQQPCLAPYRKAVGGKPRSRFPQADILQCFKQPPPMVVPFTAFNAYVISNQELFSV